MLSEGWIVEGNQVPLRLNRVQLLTGSAIVASTDTDLQYISIAAEKDSTDQVGMKYPATERSDFVDLEY